LAYCRQQHATKIFIFLMIYNRKKSHNIGLLRKNIEKKIKLLHH